MQDDNYLSKIEKEMIAVVVSTTNRCLYCCVSHSYTLAKLLKDPIKAKNILIKLLPANNVSAMTNWPGNAKAKVVERKLSKRLKPELFKKAPNVNMLSPKPITGTPSA